MDGGQAMERMLEITLEVGGYDRKREEDIKRACMVEWNFREEDFIPGHDAPRRMRVLRACALGTLYDGEDPVETVMRIERAVWRANRGMCHVAVGTREITSRAFDRQLPSDEEYERQIA